MTKTTTHTAQALLVAAVKTLNGVIRDAKKAGATVPGLATEVGDGITLRDLKTYLKEFDANQASAKTPAVKAPVKTPAPKADAKPAAKAEPVELKTAAIMEAGTVKIGRNSETVARVRSIGGVRTAVTDKGTRIAAADLEFNNRGALRVKLDCEAKYNGKAAAPAAKAADVQEDFTEEKAPVKPSAKPAAKAPAAAEGRVFPVRVLNLKKSPMLTAAEYDRNTKTLFVTLKDGVKWAYENVALSEARAFEQASQPWKHFSQHIVDDKKGAKVVSGKATVQAPKAEAKPAAKTPAVKPAAAAPAPAASAVSTSRLRAEGFVDGRTKEQVQVITKNKETGERFVNTVSGKKIPLSFIIEVKGKFRVSDLAGITDALVKGGAASTNTKATAKAPAGKPAKPAENTRKAPAQAAVNGKAQKLNFAAAEGKGSSKASAKVVSEKPTRSYVKEHGVRVIKGTKEKTIDILRVVTRGDVLTAVSSAAGHAGIPFDLIVSFDGVPTFTGKITAAEFNAL